MDAEQRLIRVHSQLMGNPLTMAFSGILMVGRASIADGKEVPTACTNGRDVFYGRKFVDSLTDPELAGLVIHESLHKVYQHAIIWRDLWKKNPKRANQAADYVINLEIKALEAKDRRFICLPRGGLYDPQYAGMDTGEVFRKLEQQGGGDSVPNQEGFDEHHFDELSEEELSETASEIDTAVRQGLFTAGKMGGNSVRSLLEAVRPVVNWREQLRDFMQSLAQGKECSTWSRPNRRWLGEGIYLPHRISEGMGSIVVGLDTSGSLGRRELASFLVETASLVEQVNPSLLHWIELDCKIQAHKVYDQTQFGQIKGIESVSGGGGTDMRKLFEYLDERQIKPEAVIVLTDGDTPYPDSVKYNTLWAMTTDRVSPVGTTIRIK